MGNRYYIHVGDRTSAGGVVLTGLSTHTWHSHANSFEEDTILCPACNSSGMIRCIGTRISNIGPTGKQQALDGDLCICKCNPSPRLIASQDTYGTQGDATAGFQPFEAMGKNRIPAEPDYDNKWIKFKLNEKGNCEGIECIAHFDDGSKMKGSFDSDNLVSFYNVTGDNVEYIDFLLI